MIDDSEEFFGWKKEFYEVEFQRDLSVPITEDDVGRDGELGIIYMKCVLNKNTLDTLQSYSEFDIIKITKL